jgi:hypothetical protein
MISISTKHIQRILKTNQASIEEIIINKKQEVQAFKDTPARPGKKKGNALIPMLLDQHHKGYLELLLQNFEDIVLATPEKIEIFKDQFDVIISGPSMRIDNIEFKNELIRRMGYTLLREGHFPNHFSQTSIKACVYCNSQLAVTVTGHNKRRAKFQVDHFLPKSEYPCFSISYFNLFPSCGPCNGRKSAKSISFELYSDDPEKLRKSGYRFKLDKRSVIKYKISGETDLLEFEFDNEDYDKAFDITGIYDTQKDVIEELVLKSIMYDKTYLETLKKSFNKLYPLKAPMASRLFIGNYTQETEIHKRPLSKFTQDIARQLKLI